MSDIDTQISRQMYFVGRAREERQKAQQAFYAAQLKERSEVAALQELIEQLKEPCGG